MWLNRSLSLYEWVWQYGWDEQCGGFWWQNCDNMKFKDLITNVEVLHFSAKLAYLFPNETRYLQDAEKIWDWFFSFDNGSGLLSENNLLSTGVIPEKCCNSTSESYSRCYNTKLAGTSYNQGVMMSASAYLFLRTNNASYLKFGLKLLNATLANYTTSEGLLRDEPRSYQSFEGSCWAGADPGGDWYSFNGIFMLHLSYFVDLLVKNNAISLQDFQNIATLVKRTSDVAWNRSVVWPPFNTAAGEDYDGCDIGVTAAIPGAHYPKFHWWWGKEETVQTIPPDPRYFFHRRKLGCVASNSSKPLWTGHTKKEEGCMAACKSNVKCSKYQFRITIASSSREEVAKQKKPNCWLWSFNRSDHTCRNNNPNFNIGIKRPVSINATCAAKCNSKEPLAVDHGVCYCDANCSLHMDCCLDYADYCQAGVVPLCKGDCTDLTPKPIAKGGYCWCFDGCNGWFTDNNSDGSCCSDYPQQCMGVSMPTCLDGRSQVSALSLFLAHMKITII